MARSHGRVLVDIWADDDFLDLTPAAQRQFFVLLSQPSLNFAGLLAYQPRRWAATSRHLALTDVIDALAELADRRYVLIALSTEELVVRSYARHDVRTANPKMAAALASHATQIQSGALRHALADELARIDLDPEKNAKSVETLAEAIAVLRKRPITDRIADGITLRNTVQNTDPITNQITNAISETPALALTTAPTPATAPASAASDDDCSSSPPSADQSSSPSLQALADELERALGSPVRFTKTQAVSGIDLDRLAAGVTRHGTKPYVDEARAASNGRGPADHIAAYLPRWRALTDRLDKGAPAKPVTSTCVVHEIAYPALGMCPSCRADRLAGDNPDDAKPSIGGGTPMPPDIRDQVKAAITPPATDPKPQEEPQPVTVPPAAPNDPPF